MKIRVGSFFWRFRGIVLALISGAKAAYGDRLHRPLRDRRKYLQQTIEKCF